MNLKATVVIIGGGASGALTAIQLARRIGRDQVLVIEPRPKVGLGIAYSTQNARHLLNVRAGNMSALPNEPNHFVSWWAARNATASDKAFAPRQTWGLYLNSLFVESGVRHLQHSVRHVDPGSQSATVFLDNDKKITAKQVVLATGHALPVDIPQRDGSLTLYEKGDYVRDVWGGWLRLPKRDEPVVLVGTGLTSIDTLLTLRASGHEGRVLMISRHGLLTSAHAAIEAKSPCVIPPDTPATVSAYLRCFRTTFADKVSWQAKIDSLRGSSNALWARLPIEEKRRFRRHLFHHWNISRHRMAPEIAANIKEEVATGRLTIRKAHVQSVAETKEGVGVSVRSFKSDDVIQVGMMLNCTGPDMNFKRNGNLLFTRLFATGHAVPGDLGIALATDAHGSLLNYLGNPSNMLYAIGPLLSGSRFETTAIPEIRVQAQELAQFIGKYLGL